MNIFYVDKDARLAAEALCDRHVVKMVLETAQILCTVQRRYGNDNPDLYRATHQYHPSTRWAGASQGNYEWLVFHFLFLCAEYTYRYGRDHACERLVPLLLQVPARMPQQGFTDPPQAMPDDCKITGDTVSAYRKYYNTHKRRMFAWTRRSRPSWITTTTTEKHT